MAKYFLFFVIVFSLTSNLSAQTYQSGKTTITYTDATRSRSIATDIYYPANATGVNVPLAAGVTRFPLVVFGHGFTIGTASYAKLGDTLSKYGYVAAFPSTETGFSPSHDNFGKDLSFISTAIINSDTIAGSFFYQRLVHKVAVGGHSMGGGCSFLAAASQNPLIDALFNMSAAETNPSAITAAASVSIPTLIFSGSNDCIVAPSVQQSMYNNLISSCKSAINITGATHCQFADDNFNCTFGQLTSGCNTSPITVAIVYKKLTDLLIPFLDYHLKENCLRGVDYVTNVNSLSGIAAQNTCAIPVCQILPLNVLDFYGKIINDKAVLSWEINDIRDILSFELEKSKDGHYFEWAGSLNTTEQHQYTIIDDVPFSDRCFYRLKIKSINNNIVYSKTIVLNKPVNSIEVANYYPNPANDFITASIVSKVKTSINIKIINTTGVVVHHQYNTIFNGNNDISISVKKLPSGVYFLKFLDQKNQTIKIIKLFKN